MPLTLYPEEFRKARLETVRAYIHLFLRVKALRSEKWSTAYDCTAIETIARDVLWDLSFTNAARHLHEGLRLSRELEQLDSLKLCILRYLDHLLHDAELRPFEEVMHGQLKPLDASLYLRER